MSLTKLQEALESLGLTQNEAKVLLTLLIAGKPLNASEISRRSGVPRPNVYETLNKLVSRGFVIKEASGRGSKYLALPISEIFETLEREHEEAIRKVREVKNLFEKQLEEAFSLRRNLSEAAWLISGYSRIDKVMRELIEEARDRIQAIITPDVMHDRGPLLVNMLEQKARENVEIIVCFKVTRDVLDLVKRVAEVAEVYHWNLGEMPLGCYVSDGSRCLVTLVGSWSPLLTYDIGLWTENPMYARSFEYLVEKLISLSQPLKDRLKEMKEGVLGE
ncbi:MAG: TrmB family transcriptional regulator [Candidatus Baldrarchaeia archaeon]